MMRKTYTPKKSELTRRWHLVDLENQALGRAASQIAAILKGKHKPEYTPHMDTGDYVIAINASRVRLTGRKAIQKKYYRHSGYIGNLRNRTAGEMLETNSPEMLMKAVKGMLPHNALGRAQLKKLKVYAEDKHPHEAQQPNEFKLI